MFSKHLMLAAAALGTAALALAPSAVKADTATLTVKTTVANSCQFSTKTDTVDFGAYTGAKVTRTYTASYTCTSGDTTYTFGFQSSNAVGVGNCSMTDGNGHKLAYVISDASNVNSTYGCDSGSFPHTATSEPAGNGTTVLNYGFTFTLNPNQTQVVGSYSDTVTVSITP
jgi:hypothetical protein